MSHTADSAQADAAGNTGRQKLAAEGIGTFLLVLLGCGTAVYGSVNGGVNIVATGLSFGLTVAVLAYAFGRVSGAHFNPAVTVGAVVSGRLPWRQVPMYVGAQLVGAVAAGVVLWILFQGYADFDATGSMGQNGYGEHSPGADYAWWAAFLLEALMTVVFLLVILAVTDPRFEHPALAPLAIGLTLAIIHFVAIPATGTSVNPARSIGPALFAGADAIVQLWLFILAPVLGAALAGLAYPALFGRATDAVPGSGLALRRREVPRSTEPAAMAGYGTTDQFQQEWNQPETGALGTGAGAGTVAGTGAGAGAGATGPSPEATQAWEPEPIIQDGWRWDYQAQEWKPLDQWPDEGGHGQQR